MVLKAKKEAPAPPKVEVKAKALKAQKAGRKGIHSHKRKTNCTITHLPGAKTLGLQRCTQEKQAQPLHHHQIPLTTESAMKKTEDNDTLVFLVDVKANTHQIKQAMKKLCDVDVAKANALIRPEGEKEACVWLAPGHDALDVANETGII
ncbi:60S ribosomal protein L23a-like [Acomys russatus]|uniref:60S ribosomal protein L23a-like n=1 Tax=Acomys russatus TaxID=60746 RepID=UPI0021E286E2|nr:60S ribosomal protein L23a-like [Acomys russatus]